MRGGGEPFTVAVTRPEPQASATAARLVADGYAVVNAPLLAVRPVADPGSAAGIGTLALTSRTAARLLAAHPRFHAIAVLAVGDGTAAEARSAGFRAIQSAEGDGEALLPLLRAAAPPVVHMAGDDHRGALVERLMEAGVPAARRILYRMVPAGPLPPVNRVDAVLLYSPRTAELFAVRATATPWRGAFCLALSPAVAVPLAAFPVHVARRPDEAAMLELLASVRADAFADGTA